MAITTLQADSALANSAPPKTTLQIDAADLTDVHQALDLAVEMENFHTKAWAILCAIAEMGAFELLPADKTQHKVYEAATALLDIMDEGAARVSALADTYGNSIACVRDAVAEMLPPSQISAEKVA